MQMRLAERMIDAGDAALEDRIEIFRRVVVNVVAEPGVFVRRVVHRVMRGELFAECGFTYFRR